MKKLFLFIVAILSLLITPTRVLAQETNQFGIHILETGEVDQAAELVNSNGGDWGWVTIVLRDNDMDKEKWQNFFNQCRRQHLVPIIRLATHIENNAWAKPDRTTIKQMVQFLASLNWPIQKRYITVFNEPNHAKEWGGEISASEYAVILDQAITAFKAAGDDFQVLNAGLDLAAPNSPRTQNAFNFLQEMYQTQPEIFQQLDGWVSHSYPNPGFIGRVTDTGKLSIRGYSWELYVLRRYFGLRRNLPVLITETGWPHAESTDRQAQLQKFYSAEKVAWLMENAFQIWQEDQRVKAVTPFVLNYHAVPLDTFSWCRQDGDVYPQFNMVKKMAKASWRPQQITRWGTVESQFPQFLPLGSDYGVQVVLKNIGQSIWGEREHCLKSRDSAVTDICLGENEKIYPGESEIITIPIQTPDEERQLKLSWEGLSEEAVVYLFDANQISSYRQHFFQKIFSVIKVWWYDKKRYDQEYQAAAQP